MAEWRQSILEGVDRIHVPSSITPGTMIVHGTNCKPIVANQKSEALIAAGQLGSGRVVVFTHDLYTNLFLQEPTSNHRLVKNIKSWVTQNTYTNDDEIAHVDQYRDFDDIPTRCKILVWVGMAPKSDEFCCKLRDWVGNGGGVVCGATPWGYCQIFPNNTLDDLPLNQLLNAIGVTYTEQCLSGGGDINLSMNQADIAALDDAIKAATDDKINLEKYSRNIETAIPYLSDKELEKLLPDIENLIKKHSKTTHCIPTKTQPVKTEKGRRLASLMCNLMVRMGKLNGEKIAPGIKEFPGDFDGPTELINGNVEISYVGGQSRTYPTGYYLPAGQDLTVSWSQNLTSGWTIFVGAHCDKLYDIDSEWRRWPQIQIEKKLESNPLIFSSPFGGSIYLKSPPNGKAETVALTLGNVVAAPIFHPGLEGDWKTRRASPGLWADISGEKMTITLPAESVRGIDDPAPIMALWDAVVSAHYDLRGLDPSSGRGQWAVTDQQPSAGYMHAGYPIITMMDVADPNKEGQDAFLLNRNLLQSTGMWGMFHELGHNMQDSMWTWSGAGEVTCNIFTLHAMSVIAGKDPWSHPWLKRAYPEMKSYLEAGADFCKWRQQPAVALGIYAQLARDFGWTLYKDIFRQYDSLHPQEKPRNDGEKINQWISRCSATAQKNLCPVFDFWGFPIEPRVLDEVKHLPGYMPADESTQKMAPGRASEIRKKYGISGSGDQEGISCMEAFI